MMEAKSRNEKKLGVLHEQDWNEEILHFVRSKLQTVNGIEAVDVISKSHRVKVCG